MFAEDVRVSAETFLRRRLRDSSLNRRVAIRKHKRPLFGGACSSVSTVMLFGVVADAVGVLVRARHALRDDVRTGRGALATALDDKGKLRGRLHALRRVSVQ